MSKVEELLQSMKENYDEIQIPDNIDDFIKSGIEKGENLKNKPNKNKFFKVAACISLILFLTCIRVSSTFASYLSNVPGLSYIVRLVNYDKGLQSAINNNFMQHIGAYDEKHGIKFTVNDVIIDEQRMIIFYSIENKNKDGFVNLYKFNITGNNNEYLDFSTSNVKLERKDIENKNLSFGRINISFDEQEKIPDSYIIKLAIIKSKNEDYTMMEKRKESTNILDNSQIYKDFMVKFSVDKSKFQNMKKNYIINKTVEIENQRITFTNAVISPTRIAVKIKFDPSNTKKILKFDDLKLVDQNGNLYGHITNGISSTTVSSDNGIEYKQIYFESNYFENPKSLFITFSSIEAVDKDKTKVKIDLDNKKIISKPDNNLILNNIIENDKSIFIDYSIKTNSEFDKNRISQIFGKNFEDSNGNIYYIKDWKIKKNEDSEKGVTIEIPNENYKNPIIFTINDYPSRIKGNVKIKIK